MRAVSARVDLLRTVGFREAVFKTVRPLRLQVRFRVGRSTVVTQYRGFKCVLLGRASLSTRTWRATTRRSIGCSSCCTQPFASDQFGRDVVGWFPGFLRRRAVGLKRPLESKTPFATGKCRHNTVRDGRIIDCETTLVGYRAVNLELPWTGSHRVGFIPRLSACYRCNPLCSIRG